MPRRTAQSVADVILGEATWGTPAERYADMLAIASVISNRSRSLGVTPEEVVQNRNEFNAYDAPLPAGVDRYRTMAERAMEQVETNGPVHEGTFYATPAATGNLPRGLQSVHETTGHRYFTDPQSRAIGTAVGYKQPMRLAVANPPVPTPAPMRPPSSRLPGTASVAAYAPAPRPTSAQQALAAMAAPASLGRLASTPVRSAGLPPVGPIPTSRAAPLGQVMRAALPSIGVTSRLPQPSQPISAPRSLPTPTPRPSSPSPLQRAPTAFSRTPLDQAQEQNLASRLGGGIPTPQAAPRFAGPAASPRAYTPSMPTLPAGVREARVAPSPARTVSVPPSSTARSVPTPTSRMAAMTGATVADRMAGAPLSLGWSQSPMSQAMVARYSATRPAPKGSHVVSAPAPTRSALTAPQEANLSDRLGPAPAPTRSFAQSIGSALGPSPAAAAEMPASTPRPSSGFAGPVGSFRSIEGRMPAISRPPASVPAPTAAPRVSMAPRSVPMPTTAPRSMVPAPAPSRPAVPTPRPVPAPRPIAAAPRLSLPSPAPPTAPTPRQAPRPASVPTPTARDTWNGLRAPSLDAWSGMRTVSGVPAETFSSVQPSTNPLSGLVDNLGGVPGIAGSVIGGALGGPIGGLVGNFIGRQIGSRNQGGAREYQGSIEGLERRAFATPGDTILGRVAGSGGSTSRSSGGPSASGRSGSTTSSRGFSGFGESASGGRGGPSDKQSKGNSRTGKR